MSEKAAVIIITRQYFTLPHQFQVDSLGVLGSPRDSYPFLVDSYPFQVDSYHSRWIPRFPVNSYPFPVDSYHSQWIPTIPSGFLLIPGGFLGNPPYH